VNIEVADGVELYVQELGEGRPFVMLPGTWGSTDSWDTQVGAFAPTHRTIAIDLRGQGKSDKPIGAYPLSQHVSDIVAVLDKLDLNDAVIMGWSLGGAVAFGVAAARPERVSQLILASSNAVRFCANDEFPFGFDEATILGLRNEERLRRPTLRAGAMQGLFYSPPDDGLLRWLVNDSMLTPSWSGDAIIEGLASGDQLDKIEAITMPVLQIHGQQDLNYPIDGARWLNKRLSNATLVEIDECAHAAFLEHPETFNRAVTDFVAR
jgi:pimeloyl-ACP methyl ester carboxylesterase